MLTRHLILIALMVFNFAATTLHAQTLPDAPVTPDSAPAPRTQGFDQVLYKGVVGNMLEAVPMEADQRKQLQRANAVVSGAMSGRSLSMLAKLAHPGFLIGGLAWGLWAAAKIDAAPQDRAVLAIATTNNTTDTNIIATVAPAATAVVTAAADPESRPRVIRVWLSPQAY